MKHWMDILEFPRVLAQLREIDLELQQLQAAFSAADDPLAILENIDFLADDGFLKLQLYMIARKGELDAKTAYDCGQRHNRFFFADVINTAATSESIEPSGPKTERHGRMGSTEPRSLSRCRCGRG